MYQERLEQKVGASPKQVAEIYRGVTALVMSLKISPKNAGKALATLDDDTAGGIAYLTSGYSDERVVKQVGETLKNMTG